ncbi:hypothetical protein ACHQM5_024820 [Ranunculus cassubicifolius]
MDLNLLHKGIDYSRRRKKWLLLMAAFGISGYGVYKVYNLPSVVQKRKKLVKLVGTLISLIEVVADSTETIGVVSKDLKEFLMSDSDEIPTSLKQISKIARSEEFSQSVVRVTEALTVGILRGYYKTESKGEASSGFSDKVFDKLFSTAGTGFASVVVGSFAKNLVLAFYEEQESHDKGAQVESDVEATPRWVSVICNDKCKKMIADSIQMFVSTAVAVYLDKTMDINTYDEIFAGLTNPKHETKIRDIMGSLCNGAVETLIKTSHHVMTSPASNSLKSDASSSSSSLDIDQGDVTEGSELRKRNSGVGAKDGGWVDKVSSTLAVPSNRSFVLDVTGRVTSETVRSFLEFVLWRLLDGFKRSYKVVHDEVVERGLDVFRYVGAKSAALVTMCFAFCLHLVGGYRVLMPA